MFGSSYTCTVIRVTLISQSNSIRRRAIPIALDVYMGSNPVTGRDNKVAKGSDAAWYESATEGLEVPTSEL